MGAAAGVGLRNLHAETACVRRGGAGPVSAGGFRVQVLGSGFRVEV